MSNHPNFIILLIVLALPLSDLWSQEDRPDILLIMNDDQGYGDPGYHGDSQIHTPSLDDPDRDSAYFDPVLWKNNERYPAEGYCSDVFTDEAINLIRQNRDRPFLAYLAFMCLFIWRSKDCSDEQ